MKKLPKISVKKIKALKAFIEEKREEINTALNDYRILSQVAIEHKWDKQQPYDPALMKRQLFNATELSNTARKNLSNAYFDRLVKQKLETKVMLSLPEQLTPEGRKYTIEGVVDIIREQDQTAIIATSLPVTLRDAVRKNDNRLLTREMERWQPLIDIPFNQEKVAETINEFGQVVDAIESRQFQPPSIEKLRGKLAGKKVTFAVQVCRNCDARFSCSAYRRYVKSSSSQADSLLSRFLNDYGTDSEREDFLYGNLENIPDVESFDI